MLAEMSIFKGIQALYYRFLQICLNQDSPGQNLNPRLRRWRRLNLRSLPLTDQHGWGGLWDIAYPELSVVKIEKVLISIFYISENPIFVLSFNSFLFNKRVHTENEMVVIVDNLGIGTPLCTCAFRNHKK